MGPSSRHANRNPQNVPNSPAWSPPPTRHCWCLRFTRGGGLASCPAGTMPRRTHQKVPLGGEAHPNRATVPVPKTVTMRKSAGARACRHGGVSRPVPFQGVKRDDNDETRLALAGHGEDTKPPWPGLWHQ